MSDVFYQRRMRAEKRFKRYGFLAMLFALVCLTVLLGNILWRGAGGFMQTNIRMDIPLSKELLELQPGQTAHDLSPARFNILWREALVAMFPEVTDREAKKELYKIMSSSAGVVLKGALEDHPEWFGNTKEFLLPAADLKTNRSDLQAKILKVLEEQHAITTGFNRLFFTRADSRSPESAGFLGAIVGSLWAMLVCILAAFPMGVMSAVYLEEFSRKTRFAEFIEVNVNNLAAVPSIVYGLLGLSVYINLMGMPRSAPIVGGLTLALMVMPIIIISTRTALKSVPSSIRQAALALGASPLQTVWHHTLPLAMPGVMTGTILGMARAIGETAPLLMIGMVAFVVDVPSGITSAATAMPVQIYLWASNPEVAFVQKTASAILVLIVLLLAMNALAIYLRKKFEVRW